MAYNLKKLQNLASEAVANGDSTGFCKQCGAEAEGVEPDARDYVCDECGEEAVYGAEEILLATVY